MSSVFVDTSAIYAYLVPQDEEHETAEKALRTLHESGANLVSSSFVLQETVALLQARIGIAAVRTFDRDVTPAMEVVWISASLYERAMSALLAAAKRGVSLTDWTSFEVMRERGIDRAFAFDPHFAEQGFALVSVNGSR